jgi:hypothetical protein
VVAHNKIVVINLEKAALPIHFKGTEVVPFSRVVAVFEGVEGFDRLDTLVQKLRALVQNPHGKHEAAVPFGIAPEDIVEVADFAGGVVH